MNISPDKTGIIKINKPFEVVGYSWYSGRRSLRINKLEITLTDEQYLKLKDLFRSETETEESKGND